MEEYLRQLYEEEGVGIFRSDYPLLLKLLDQYPQGPFREDAYCIHALLGGNALYKSLREALQGDTHEVSPAEYNVFLAQMYRNDRFWKKEGCAPGHMEDLLRMIYRVVGIHITGIPRIIPSDQIQTEDKEILLQELYSAEIAYQEQEYSAAVEKGERLFEQGVNSAALVLSKAYYYGQGTLRDYNKAFFYLTYPHRKNKEEDKEERGMLEHLLELRDKTTYSALAGLAGSVLVLLFLAASDFFRQYPGFAAFFTVVLAVGSLFLLMMCKRKRIFDFSYWFLLLGCMFLTVLLL